MNIPKFLIVHHAGGTDGNPLADSSNFSFNECNELHRKNWNFKSSLGFYIGYQYYIEKNGKVTQGRADTDEGAHTIGKNNSSIGICLAGNFDATLPTTEQIASLKKLLIEKMRQYNLSADAIVPHRTFAVKTCYGKRLTDSWARDLVTDVKPADDNLEKARALLAQAAEFVNQAVELLKK